MAQYHPNSMRANEARAGKIANSTPVKALLFLALITLLGFGIALLFIHKSVGWVLIGCAFVPLELMLWTKYELKHVPIGKSNRIDDLLSNECLVHMGKHPTPQQIATWFYKTRSGNFLAMRYAITPNFMQMITQSAPQDMAPFYDKALEIREKTNSEVISAGVLVVAIIACHPNCEMILNKMKLEIDDLYDGLTWFNYLNDLVKGTKQKNHTGGFARDLMFGYTPLLQRYAQNISKRFEARVGRDMSLQLHRQQIQQMVDVFSKAGRQNVALIGPEGCGRGTIVNDFASEIMDADKKISSRLKFRQVFKLDASALISAAADRSQLEYLMTRILNEAYSAKNVILWLDNAQVFMEDGPGSVDITSTIMPAIESGSLRIILTLDEQRFLEISARKSTLANLLNKIMIEPASESDTLKVLQDRVPIFEYQNHVTYTVWALKEAYRLSERYVHDLVMPGRAINLLETAASYPIDERGYITDASVQKAVEQTYGVKMQSSHTDEDKSKLLNMESFIHERLIGQDLAVKAVSDALRRAAAGVRNEQRPIGTFLFLGPTGVGKTELAKAISEVYFKGEGEIVRIDLNEYVSADDVQRLIADGAENELSLTAQVMKHPFSVVLLDEIEKAHPLVLTTLLQLLDEGILRDVRNREVSFRDTIVIATSNAGANKIREYIDAGEDMATIKEQLTNDLIATSEFKPEFLNRFDEICVFQPLTKEALYSIVDIIIDGVNKTLAPRKIHVSVNDEAKTLLVEHGYDPKLGARPMRRIVSKTVENIVARSVLSGTADNGADMVIDADMIQSALN